jgi:hypothetical protein
MTLPGSASSEKVPDTFSLRHLFLAGSASSEKVPTPFPCRHLFLVTLIYTLMIGETIQQNCLSLWHSDRKLGVTVPVQTGTDIGRGLAARILKDAGFTVEDYLRLR